MRLEALRGSTAQKSEPHLARSSTAQPELATAQPLLTASTLERCLVKSFSDLLRPRVFNFLRDPSLSCTNTSSLSPHNTPPQTCPGKVRIDGTHPQRIQLTHLQHTLIRGTYSPIIDEMPL